MVSAVHMRPLVTNVWLSLIAYDHHWRSQSVKFALHGSGWVITCFWLSSSVICHLDTHSPAILTPGCCCRTSLFFFFVFTNVWRIRLSVNLFIGRLDNNACLNNWNPAASLNCDIWSVLFINRQHLEYVQYLDTVHILLSVCLLRWIHDWLWCGCCQLVWCTLEVYIQKKNPDWHADLQSHSDVALTTSASSNCHVCSCQFEGVYDVVWISLHTPHPALRAELAEHLIALLTIVTWAWSWTHPSAHKKISVSFIALICVFSLSSSWFLAIFRKMLKWTDYNENFKSNNTRKLCRFQRLSRKQHHKRAKWGHNFVSELCWYPTTLLIQ